MWQYKDHTADILIEARNKDRYSTLKDLLLGFFNLFEKQDNKPLTKKTFYFEFTDGSIISLFNDIIFFSEENDLVPINVELETNKAIVYFSKGQNAKIKAATFHKFMFKDDFAQIIIDI